MKKFLCSLFIIIFSFSMISCSNTSEVKNNYLYSEDYMGIWYGFGTDGNKAQFKFEFTPIDETTVSVTRSGWGTNSNLDETTVVIEFKSNTVAETELTNGVKQQFEFKTENGEKTIILNYVNAAETPIAEATYIYRNSIK